MIRDPGDGRDAEHFSGSNHVLYLVQIHGTVLTIDHHEVVAQCSEEFHLVRGVTVDDRPEDYLPFGQFCFGGVGAHEFSSF